MVDAITLTVLQSCFQEVAEEMDVILDRAKASLDKRDREKK